MTCEWEKPPRKDIGSPILSRVGGSGGGTHSGGLEVESVMLLG
jgi:hypothetical protein